MTVDHLLSLFLAGHASAGHSASTIGWYEYEIRRFLAWLQANQFRNGNWLRPEVIEAYLADARESGNAPATVAGHYRALKGFFAWLRQRGYIESSPLEAVQPPKVPRTQPRRAALDEYARLLDSIPQGTWIELRDRLIISTLFLCGLRRQECASLIASDFRTSEHLLIVRHGKGGHDRFVPMLPAVERALVAYLWLRPHTSTGALLLAANGAGKPTGPMSSSAIYQMLRRRCHAAGLRNLNPHAFRHGLAMHLLNQGGDMSLVQKVLGHAQIATTAKHYAEWLTEGMLREFATKMRGVGR